jgi:hypothetical protein
MAQVFHPSMNVLAKASIAAVLILAGAGGWIATAIDRSPYLTRQGIMRDQPVMFSHQHHVEGLGIDCRYCHNAAEQSWYAGMPPTKTCMTCHSVIWTGAPILQPVRDSFGYPYTSGVGIPIKWQKVHNLQDFVYFNHSIHVAKGIGCSTCHGHVEQMPMMYQAASLQMRWCVTCHRDPAQFIRPRSQIYNQAWRTTADQQADLGPKLVKEYKIQTDQLTNCSICHR